MCALKTDSVLRQLAQRDGAGGCRSRSRGLALGLVLALSVPSLFFAWASDGGTNHLDEGSGHAAASPQQPTAVVW